MFEKTGISSLNGCIVYISGDGPGQETFNDDEPALPPDLAWLEDLYEWVFLAFSLNHIILVKLNTDAHVLIRNPVISHLLFGTTKSL